MKMPEQIGGKPGDKPSLSVTIVRSKPDKMPEQIGGEPGRRDEEDEDVPVSRQETMDDMASAIVKNLTSVKPDPKRLAKDLYAFCRAADIDDEDYSEGEEKEEEG